MKKVLCSLMLAAAMLAGTAATAATQSFDSKVAKFSVDVPDGWNGKAISDGCLIASDDGQNSVSIQFLPPGDLPAGDVAKKIAQASGVQVKEENVEGDGAVISGELQGTPMTILVVKTPEMYNVAVFGGNDMDTMKAIYGSAK